MVHASGLVLVFNGEVYSFPEIRRELEAEGATFTSTGDTEVVLAALARWGVACLDRFRRDVRPGIVGPRPAAPPAGARSPRHQAAVRRVGSAGLVFASEVPAVLAHPMVSGDIDRGAVARWLQQGYPAGRTMLAKGVWRLPPGHLLEAEDGRTTVRPWYNLLDRVQLCGEEQAGDADERLAELLREAVRCRLVSDVPLGCFLSGGWTRPPWSRRPRPPARGRRP